MRADDDDSKSSVVCSPTSHRLKAQNEKKTHTVLTDRENREGLQFKTGVFMLLKQTGQFEEQPDFELLTLK